MWLQIVIAALMWGIAPLFETKYTENVSIYTVAVMFTVMIVIAAPFLGYLTRKTWMKELPTLFTTNRHVLYYGLGGLIVSVIAMGTYLSAIQNSGNRVYLVVTLTCVYPLITALLLWAIMKEKVSAREWIGIALVVVGTMLLVRKDTVAVEPFGYKV